MSNKIDLAAVGLGLFTYVYAKRHESDRFGVGSLGGAALAIYALSHINAKYANYAVAAYLGSEVFLPMQVKMLAERVGGESFVGAPGQDYSFTRRPGYNDKNY